VTWLRSRATLLLAGVAAACTLFAALELLLRATGRGVERELVEFDAPEGRRLTRYRNWPDLAKDPARSLDRIACAVAKPAGTLRVVVVGESTAAGFPFAPQFSFARVLEARLRRDHPDRAIEIVDFGRAADPSAAVAETAREAMACAPDLLVICSGHNEYQASYVDELRDGFGGALQRTVGRLRLAGLLRPPRAANGDDPAALDLAARAGGGLVGAGPFLGPDEFARGVARFREHLEAMVAAARAGGAKALLMTQASNLSRFAPCYSFHSKPLLPAVAKNYDHQLSELLRLARSEPWSEQSRRLSEALAAQDPDVALRCYVEGLRLEAQGSSEEAAREFARALELDGYPNRARAALNETIRSVARESGAALVDVVATFQRATQDAAPGDDLFLDHCHPTLEATFAVADALLPEVERALGLAAPPGAERRPACFELASVDDWLREMKLSRAALANGPITAGNVSLLLHLQSPGSGEALRLARRGFETGLKLDVESKAAMTGLLVVELLDRHKELALFWQERLLARAPDALAAVESQVKSRPPLAEALRDLGLTFEHGRLVPATARRDGP
jgi:tetratricopeptide (TPR) repeat protein